MRTTARDQVHPRGLPDRKKGERGLAAVLTSDGTTFDRNPNDAHSGDSLARGLLDRA